MSLYQYDDSFFAYQQIGALRSARAVAPLLLRSLRPTSILDVGCGAGAWTRAYFEADVRQVMGIDGAHVGQGHLMVDASAFSVVDVSKPFHLGRAFDMVQCLEVAEHLDPSAGGTLVDNLVSHSQVVLFSAAPPGQGGEHHVNERPYEYWRALFAHRGYETFDFVRPRIADRLVVEPWYRYNILLFVHRDAEHRLDGDVAASKVARGEQVRDVSPLTYRARKRLLSLAPAPVVTWMASVKHRLALRDTARVQAT